MQFLQTNWMLILLAFMSGAMLLFPFLQKRASGMADIGTFNATHLINREDALLLDVREAREYTQNKAGNALHIPYSQLATRSSEIGKVMTRPVIVYDAKGQRARGAGSVLKKAGFTQLYHLQGGLQAWRDAGLPTEKIA